MSETLKKLIRTNIGYRNEALSENPTHMSSLIDMLNGEIEESGNTDIFKYLKNELCEDAQLIDVLKYVAKKLKKPITDINAIWLTSNDGLTNYTNSRTEDNNIVAYDIHQFEPYVVLSDLDGEGVLLATTQSSKKAAQYLGSKTQWIRYILNKLIYKFRTMTFILDLSTSFWYYWRNDWY